ncbi:hypothetical protein GF324_00415, partial [bacterium]|nr:hypothetical protein [bacterium]
MAVAPGITIGPAALLLHSDREVQRRTIDASEIDAEIDRLDRAIERTRRDIENNRAKATASLGEIVARIFDAHLLILEDEPTFDQIRMAIADEQVSADFSLWRTLTSIARSFSAQKDDLFRERAQDVRDVCMRLL